ncbi:YIP1 family protein [Leptolyngbya ohadii]|uniref:YIP1 family protein n=1 Tax=Leptolyngbya ohadii TaxID=1962290 RepID=UPI0015C5BD6C|nr:YIP1 family protein [Leptolyngbya ohadii]
MRETALDLFWQLVWGSITLNTETFQQIQTLPLSSRGAFYIVLFAGLSQAIGQSIILFVNRVKPIRFVLSLVIASFLFAIGYLFWAISTWAVKNVLFPPAVSLEHVYRTLGYAYAPQLFGFLVALPYFGVPISVLLSIWSFLALLTGLAISLRLSVEQALVCGFLGWLVLEILQRTIGRPVSAIGQWLSNRVAGVDLVTDLKQVEQMMQGGFQTPPRQ